MSEIKIATTLANAKEIVVLTGTHLSATCGMIHIPIPEYQTPDSFWVGWDTISEMRTLAQNATQNIHGSAFDACYAIEKHKAKTTIATTSIDGLHHLYSHSKTIELHGNLWRTYCRECSLLIWDRLTYVPRPAICKHCGNPLFPSVVTAGSQLPQAPMEKVLCAAENADILLLVGANSNFAHIRAILRRARLANAMCVQFTEEKDSLSVEVDFVCEGSLVTNINNIWEQTQDILSSNNEGHKY